MDYRHIADRASAARAVIATASTSENAALLVIHDTTIANLQHSLPTPEILKPAEIMGWMRHSLIACS